MTITRTVAPPAAATASRQRLASLDIVRGAVMVLMAIDHVRVYSGLPAGGPTAGIFFTRWVTHFCAPAFVFLAGTSAFLHGRKLADTRALARFLATRGLILVLLELTLIHVAWTFTLDFTQLLAGVIWMIGWCMILLAALVRLRPATIGGVGLAVIAAQQIFGLLPRALPVTLRDGSSWFWQFLYTGGEVAVGTVGPTINILYTIVPWIGVMAAGYAFGAIMIRENAERRRICLGIGLSATAMFLAPGGLAVLLMPAPDDAPPIFRLLNQQKYPASQLFLLMTLGPTIALLPVAERARGNVANVLATFGRAPLFYYLLHIPLIHTIALLVMLVRQGRIEAGLYATAPYVAMPQEQQWTLGLLYVIFAAVIALLYLPCEWFAGVKRRPENKWASYL